MEEVMEQVVSRANLQSAWRQVKLNAGSAGVDGKTVADTHRHLVTHWPTLAQKLVQGTYRPGAVRAVVIPKPTGGERRLGIPTVQDRLIQQALQQVLTPQFEPLMSAHSYGFRPGRSAHDAVAAARGYVRSGKGYVVDIDLRQFFDQVDHDILMTQVGQRVGDKRVRRLIGQYLRAPLVHPDGRREARSRGTPQGGPLSPLLANIYLTPLDRELEGRGVAFVRYADDIQLYVGSLRAADRLLASLTIWLRRHLKLEVNADKSGSGPSDGATLLGFRLHANGATDLAPRTLARLKARVRMLWDARFPWTLAERRRRWQQYVIGWWAYFHHACCWDQVLRLSGWIRRHQRKYFWLRWHHPCGRRKAFSRLGVRGRALGQASSRRGAWFMARHPVLHTALPTARLAQWGFGLPWLTAS